MVGAERFELPTLCSQSRCATRLRYAPTPLILPHPLAKWTSICISIPPPSLLFDTRPASDFTTRKRVSI